MSKLDKRAIRFDCGGRVLGISDAILWVLAQRPTGWKRTEIVEALAPCTTATRQQVAQSVRYTLRYTIFGASGYRTKGLAEERDGKIHLRARTGTGDHER